MSKAFSLVCILPLLCALLSSPFANGAFIASNAGHCSLRTFWYEPIQACVPFGKRSSKDMPPDGIACPVQGDWYWSNQRSVCLPATPEPDTFAVVCPARYAWDAATSRCVHRSTACNATEFWFPARATCLARRAATPSSSTRCPSGWYWSTSLASCVPAQPEALSSALTCARGTVWSPSALICQRAVSPSRRAPSGMPSWRPGPSPSPRPSSRPHSVKARTFSPCPAGLDACPILKAGDFSDYECIDAKYDLQHCGGCSMDGRGEDCTAIRGVRNVECVRAQCNVLTCAAGYAPSTDRRTCINLLST